MKRGPDGKNLRVAVLQDGDNFGELALLRNTPRNATVETLTPAVFLTLARSHFQARLEHSPATRALLQEQEAQRKG